MRRTTRAPLLLLVAVGGCLGAAPAPAPHDGCGPDPAERLAVAINDDRRDRGIPALRTDPRLATAAQRHSADMARTGRMSHTGSDGATFDHRVEAAGYRLTVGGEVIATGYPSAVTVVANWLRSPRHRAVLLDGDAVHVGAACVAGRDGMAYWTALVAASRDG